MSLLYVTAPAANGGGASAGIAPAVVGGVAVMGFVLVAAGVGDFVGDGAAAVVDCGFAAGAAALGAPLPADAALPLGSPATGSA